MIIRHLIVCLTCNGSITTRVSVGHNPYQKHSFLCPHCDEAICLGMKVNYEEVSTEMVHVENCDQGEEEGPVVNLNPEFVVEKGDRHSDRSFAWMKQVQYIRDATGSAQLYGAPNITEAWAIVDKAWSLLINGRTDLAQETLEKYRKFDYEDDIEFEPILYSFCQFLAFPWGVEVFKGGARLLSSAVEANRDELLRFRDFYIAKWKDDHFSRVRETFRELFKHYSEYDQVILYVRNAAPVPDGSVATSASFDDTRMFYGNAYENFTSNISTLACIHNISVGRPYDTFEKMDLKKYLTINKANRGSPFKDNELLAPFLECLDSKIRNASHHGAARATKDRTMIEYRSGGTGQKHRISYSKYLEKCGQIALSSAALLMVELLLCLPPTGE